MFESEKSVEEEGFNVDKRETIHSRNGQGDWSGRYIWRTKDF